MKPILMTLLIVVAFIGGFIFDGLITRVPPDASTRGRLMRLKHELSDFYARNKTLPESLDALGKSDSAAAKSAPKENAWGWPNLVLSFKQNDGHLKDIWPWRGRGRCEANIHIDI